jgi:hypothetical protein
MIEYLILRNLGIFSKVPFALLYTKVSRLGFNFHNFDFSVTFKYVLISAKSFPNRIYNLAIKIFASDI